MSRTPSARCDLSRREFFAASAAAVLLPGAPSLAPAVERVIVVAFAGGVRSKDTIETPQNIPNLMRIASQGVVLPNVHCENTGHYGAALSIFTGNTEVLGIRENERGLNPTLFEYLRKDAGFQSSDVWLSTSGGAQGRLFAHSDHPDFGAKYGANVIDGEGIFNVEFKKILDAFGKPKIDSEAEQARMDRLSAALDPQQLQHLRSPRPDQAQNRQVEKFILDELSGASSRLTGPGASDAKAIRVGLSLFRAFQPKVLGITLQNHDIAHGSYNGYVEVIRRNDEEIGKLWDLLQADAKLRDSTAVFILPEFGRDRNLNERNGLDHGDGSDCLRKVFLIAAGPGLKKNKVSKEAARSVDLCPTLLSLFTKTPPALSKARVLKELFA